MGRLDANLDDIRGQPVDFGDVTGRFHHVGCLFQLDRQIRDDAALARVHHAAVFKIAAPVLSFDDADPAGPALAGAAVMRNINSTR
jgi:hypothetical protein